LCIRQVTEAIYKQRRHKLIYHLHCAIDAKENRYVVVSDIPGAFLNAEMEDNVHMLLEGTVTEMIVKLDPTIYKIHMWYNKHGKAMLYV